MNQTTEGVEDDGPHTYLGNFYGFDLFWYGYSPCASSPEWREEDAIRVRDYLLTKGIDVKVGHFNHYSHVWGDSSRTGSIGRRFQAQLDGNPCVFLEYPPQKRPVRVLKSALKEYSKIVEDMSEST